MLLPQPQQAYEEGYEAYHRGIDDCPYDYDTENYLWSHWCDGHMAAYCEDEGK